MTMRFSCVLAMLLVAVAILAAPPRKTNTWPKTFTLQPGQSVEFPVELPAAGTVTLEVTWQGAPLSLTVSDAWGKPVASTLEQKPPSLKQTVTITPEILRRGSTCTLTVTAGRGEQPSTGRIAVAAAPISRLPNTPVTPKPPIGPQPPGDITRPPTMAEPPVLESVAPLAGGPNQTITLKARHVPADKFQTEVFFTIAADTAVQAGVTSVTKAADGLVTLVALVPNAPTAITAYDGDVYLQLDGTDFTSNALPFRFTPTPLAPGTPIRANTAPRLAVQWKVETCDKVANMVNASTPALDEASGIVAFTTYEHNRDYGTKNERLRGFRVSDGGTVWTQTRTGVYPYQTPRAGFGLIYLPEGLGATLKAYDARTGAVRWSRYSSQDSCPPQQTGYEWAIPGANDLFAYMGGVFTVPNGTSTRTIAGRLLALDPQTGAPRWTLDEVGAESGPPTFDATSMYLCTSKGVMAIDNRTLPARWLINPAMGIGEFAPQVVNGLIYYGGVYSEVYATNTATGVITWKDKPLASPGRYEGPRNPMLVANGTLYAITSQNSGTGATLRAYNAATGALKWKASIDCSETILALHNPPITLVNDVLLVHGWKLYAFNASTGTLLWSYNKHFRGVAVYKNQQILATDWNGDLYAFTPQ